MPHFVFTAHLTVLATQLSTIALIAICGLAVWKGSIALRLGGVLILATWLITLAAAAVAGEQKLAPVAFLVSDAVLAGGLLLLAVRFSSWWMGAAMLLQAASLSLHAAYFAADKAELSHKLLNLYVLGKNLASMAMLVVLLAATLAGMVKRGRARGVPSAAPQAA